MNRVLDVIDCWYDSGSASFAQFHYPFENKEIFAKKFPADFICEGVDQTRGWFYSLLVIGTFLFDQPTYKTCVVNDLILDKDGKKMSKSVGNTVDPFRLMEKHGADVLRWYLLSVSPPWLPTKFDEEGVIEVSRKFFGTLTNTYSFFAMYANIDQFEYAAEKRIAPADRAEIDRWILSELNSLTSQVNEFLQNYDLTKAVRAIADFTVDDLSNWYVRRCRRRFWKSEMGLDKLAAFQTLHECLSIICRLAAPVAPFLSEAIYRNLKQDQNHNPNSVHLTSYPCCQDTILDFVDENLIKRMNLVRRIVELGRSIRNDVGIRVRQPLQTLYIKAADEQWPQLLKGMENLIVEELNVKSISFVTDEGELMSLTAEPVFKKLGPKFGKVVNQAAEAVRSFSEKEIKNILRNGGERLVIDGHEAMIVQDDIIVKSVNKPGIAAAVDGDLTAALSTEVSEELLFEGLAREFVNRVQNMRKDAGLEVTDRIIIHYQATKQMAAAIEKQATFIKNETLAAAIVTDLTAGGFQKEWSIDDHSVVVVILKTE